MFNGNETRAAKAKDLSKLDITKMRMAMRMVVTQTIMKDYIHNTHETNGKPHLHGCAQTHGTWV